MNNFKDYQSKPIIRKAHEITNDDLLMINSDKATIKFKDGTMVDFPHHRKIVVGDYICFRLDSDEIYHCDKHTFEAYYK